MSVPFHKQTDPDKQAGQVKRCSCGDRYVHQCPGEWEQGCDLGANEKYVARVEHTLEQYIKRKEGKL